MTAQDRLYTVEDLWEMSHDLENDLRRIERLPIFVGQDFSRPLLSIPYY